MRTAVCLLCAAFESWRAWDQWNADRSVVAYRVWPAYPIVFRVHVGLAASFLVLAWFVR